MSSSLSVAARHLVALGFTPLEADAYIFLLRESPATGYRVAQGIGRTTASTYKALEALELRGAIMVEEAETRLCRAVAPAELLGGIETTFVKHRRQAEAVLSRLGADHADDRIYQLRTPEQVYERCRAILNKATQVALLDVFPQPLRELRPDVDAAIVRGVKVGVLVYEQATVRGAEVVLHQDAPAVLKRWSAQWINLGADSEQQVHALLSTDGSEVLHGTWSASPFLAHLYQSGLLGEISASALRNAMRDRLPNTKLEAVVRRLDKLGHTGTHAFASLTNRQLRKPQRGERD